MPQPMELELLVIFFISCFKRSRMPEGCLMTGESEPANPESNASTLTVGSLLLDSYSSGSCAGKNYKTRERETVLNVFYSSRKNINLIHEVLRQVCVIKCITRIFVGCSSGFSSAFRCLNYDQCVSFV